MLEETASFQEQAPECDLADTVTVGTSGEGRAAQRVVRVGSWLLCAGPTEGEEPRIRDIDLAERLGYERPRKIREIIDRWTADLGPVHVRPTVGRGLFRGKTQHPTEVRETWLTEEQALFITAKSETPKATAILREVIRVFTLARKGLLPQQQPTEAPSAIAALAAAVDRNTATLSALAGRVSALEARPTTTTTTTTGADLVIGRAEAQRSILGPLRRSAQLRATVIGKRGDRGVVRSIRLQLDKDLRRELGFPLAGGHAWQNLPTGELGRALVKVAEITGSEERLAKLAGKGEQLTLASVHPLRPGRSGGSST